MIEPEPRRRQFWTPLSSCDKPEEDHRQQYIFAFENGALGGIAGNLPATVKRLRWHLYELSNRNVHTSVLVIDEYNTSKVCAECHTKSLVNLKAYPKYNLLSNLLSNVSNQTPHNNRKRTVHTILKCTSCGTVWNRDKMATKKIRFVFE
jgi:transposase